MTDHKTNKHKKQAELEKYRVLILTTIDYYLDNTELHTKTTDFDSVEYFKEVKTQTEEHFQKGRLTKLKQWFHDLAEMLIQTNELKFNKYLQDKTKYDIDIFVSYFQRVEKVIEKGKITTDKQFYDIGAMVDQLSQTDPVDNEKLKVLNGLLVDYEQRKSRQKSRRP